METTQNCVINKQTDTLTKMDSELTDMALKLDTMDEGVKTGFSCINKDLEALDAHVNRRHKDYDDVLEKLRVTEGRVELLEERSRTQRNMIEKLVARVEGMEDWLCCCQEGKEKGKAVEVLTSSALGSPLVLERPLTGSDGSYHTPPVALSSSFGSDKENVAIDSLLVEIKDEVTENIVPVPVQAPELDFQGIACLIVVCGQQAVRLKGPPKSAYHPYAHCCAIGDRDSTHQPGCLCLPPLFARRGLSSPHEVGHEGSDSSGESPHRVDGDDRWAHGF